MEDKDSYTPQEIAEIARAYDGYRICISAQRSKLNSWIGTMDRTSVMDSAINYAKKIPQNVRNSLGVDKEIGDLERYMEDHSYAKWSENERERLDRLGIGKLTEEVEVVPSN